MKILLVDDDELFRGALSSSLSRHGYETLIAVDGMDALEKVQHDTFDLVITDIFMPEKEGIEIIQEIRDIHPGMKIIAISSGGNVGHTSFLKIAEAMGANTSLQKPFSPESLVEKIQSLT
jgi:DNA-binding response OmpR family regulator